MAHERGYLSADRVEAECSLAWQMAICSSQYGAGIRAAGIRSNCDRPAVVFGSGSHEFTYWVRG